MIIIAGIVTIISVGWALSENFANKVLCRWT